MQNLYTVYLYMVIDIDDRCLVAVAHSIIVKEFCANKRLALQLVPKLGITLLQKLLVKKFCVEQIAALLNVCNPRLPIEIQQTDLCDGNVAQAI